MKSDIYFCLINNQTVFKYQSIEIKVKYTLVAYSIQSKYSLA